MKPYDRNKPHNQLPLLPPIEEKIIDNDILHKWGMARSAVTKLDGITNTLDDPQIMVNTIVLQEAKESSKIENIVTTTDGLYRALALSATEQRSDAAKQVIRYRESLMEGIDLLKSHGQLDKEILIRLFQIIKDSTAGVRTDLQEVWLSKGGSDSGAGERVYTPPLGNALLNEKLENLIEFLNDDEKYNYPPLIKMSIAHYQLEAIHPFIDGNGRTGRVANVLYLVNKNILKHPIAYFSRYISQNREDYQYCLKGVTERQAWKPWLLFMLEAVESTANYTIDKIEQINQQKSKTLAYVNERDSKIDKEYIEAIFIQPYIKALHLSENSKYKAKTRKTATSVLNRLVELKVLDPPKKIGREIVYINSTLINILSENDE
ncbi:MAG: Fic/DOC family protein [Flavobacteriales bacterium]|nr:MAG: Fic/DOC family protein [Flavobacteriales bacterium]